MSYTGLVHWYAGTPGTAEGQAPRRVYPVPAQPPVAWLHAPSAAPGPQGDRGATPRYGGLAGWYAAVLTAVTPVARPPLPHAA